ncbi:baseplate J/gp47 family protein [Shewanella sp. MBTL60-007]|uniref:baseplate J/gp47 family protein n=1 Tax=Shewanella sp. MBTL60-007 TaxID=2815911 RepID=UPI001BC5E9C2|nr:baseplate J/gp47 family protein [Shewanella sp. MBTL60-007]GIU12907.1 hypothetical protein TUM3792_01930 [Shewanella sp. MBTL60-007]
MTRPQVDFEKVLANEGVPMDSQQVTALLEADVMAANSIISNNSAMSPFWKLFSACVVTPVLWLIKTLLANHVLPAMFTATATDLYLELKAWDVGLERKQAVKTQGLITFTKVDANADIWVKAGTVIQSDATLGAIYRMRVLADTLIPAGVLTEAILCEAEQSGAGHNIGAGYYNVLPEVLAGIAVVNNIGDWITQSGANQETDDELALRIRDKSGSGGNYHIDAVYRAAIASFAGIRSDLLYFEHEAPRGPGTANCHVMMEVGETTQALIDNINDYISTRGYHGHGDDLLVMPIAASAQALELNFWHASNIGSSEIAQLEADIESRIRAAFRESELHPAMTRTFPRSAFIFSQLTSELTDELPHLKSVRWLTDDLINGLALPRISSLVINNRGVI